MHSAKDFSGVTSEQELNWCMDQYRAAPVLCRNNLQSATSLLIPRRPAICRRDLPTRCLSISASAHGKFSPSQLKAIKHETDMYTCPACGWARPPAWSRRLSAGSTDLAVSQTAEFNEWAPPHFSPLRDGKMVVSVLQTRIGFRLDCPLKADCVIRSAYCDDQPIAWRQVNVKCGFSFSRSYIR